MKKVHRIRKNLTEPFFRFFERYYDAKELIHKRISWNWEKYLKIWAPKLGQKL